MQHFHFILKNEKGKSYRMIILILVVLHLLFFGYLFIFEYALKKEIIILIILADIIFFLLGRMALQKTSFHFKTSSIEKRNLPKKKYSWDQLSNVVLKDNLLTLDFRNNILIQGEVEPHPFNEYAFNTFAKEQIAKHG